MVEGVPSLAEARRQADDVCRRADREIKAYADMVDAARETGAVVPRNASAYPMQLAKECRTARHVERHLEARASRAR